MTTTHDLHTRITGAIRTQQLFRPGDTLIIGLSGGADSCALLDLLASLSAFPLRLIAAHLNHTLRGSDSDDDEEFCRDLAAHHQIPFEARRVDVKALAAKESLNLEDAGRRARIAFFDELRDRWQAAAVVLAHHADDQAETLLMRLLRGSGMSGLVGMPWRNGRNYVRPLLEISRSEIEAYLSARQLNWREDASNRDTAFLRNRIRHELFAAAGTVQSGCPAGPGHDGRHTLRRGSAVACTDAGDCRPDLPFLGQRCRLPPSRF